jgi:hypothetical protein
MVRIVNAQLLVTPTLLSPPGAENAYSYTRKMIAPTSRLARRYGVDYEKSALLSTP